MRLTSISIMGTFAAVAAASAATVVMQVNGVGITDADLAQAKRGITAQQKEPADPQVVLQRAVEQAIGHTLLVQAAREAGVKVERAEVQERIAAQRGRYPNADAFAQALQASGTSEAELARHEEENLLILHFTEDKLGAKAVVTQAEARAYYDKNPTEFDHPEQVKVRMILVAVPEVASEDQESAAKLRASQVVSRLTAGEDFAAVAKDLSDDQSKVRGGEIGWVRRGQLLTELEPAVFNMKPGEFTKPLRTRYGYHVMGAIDKRGPGRSSFEEVESNLITMLKGLKVRDAIRQLVSERRASAKIETLDPDIKGALAARPSAR